MSDKREKTNSYYLHYIPVFILFVLIFKFLYLDNGVATIFNILIPILGGIFLAVVLNPLYKYILEKVINIISIQRLYFYNLYYQ